MGAYPCGRDHAVLIGGTPSAMSRKKPTTGCSTAVGLVRSMTGHSDGPHRRKRACQQKALTAARLADPSLAFGEFICREDFDCCAVDIARLRRELVRAPEVVDHISSGAHPEGVGMPN
jgi:hypothetical protein